MAIKRNLGAMRHRLTLFGIVREPDGGGGFERSDAEIADIMGSVTLASASEQMAYANLQQRATHKIIIRFRDDARQGQRIRWQHPNAPLDLYILTATDARPERPGEWLELMCREGGVT